VSALLGAMLLESAVDRFLAALMPGYDAELRDRREASFSVKIAIARALRVFPSRILGAADTVRQVRNEFAHKLDVDSLADVDPKLLTSVRGHYCHYAGEDARGKDDLTVFREVIESRFLALSIYSEGASGIRSYMEDASFREAAQRFGVRWAPSSAAYLARSADNEAG
jgi:hypothetical protein